VESSNTTLTTEALPAERCWNWNATSSGPSSWQGTHQLAKKLTTT
jgi:hypothetical protein